MSVAFATASAGSNDGSFAGDFKVGQHLACRAVSNYRTHWNTDYIVIAMAAMTIGVRAAFAGTRLALLAIAQVEQRRQLAVRHRDHTAAMTTVAAIGRTTPDKFRAVEADAARPAVAGDCAKLGFIDEFHCEATVSLSCQEENSTIFDLYGSANGLPSTTCLSQAKKKPLPGLSDSFEPRLLSRKDFTFFCNFVMPPILHNAVDQRKERIVAAHADILTRMDLGAELTNQNIARAHSLAAENLHTASLTIAIASVAGTAACFLMCH